MPKRTRKTKGIWNLRIETQRQQLVRMMFQGLSTAQCAKALHCSAETVRDLSATPEFQTLYASTSGSS
jgi:DNA-binding NarL/FixJ family response regulator